MPSRPLHPLLALALALVLAPAASGCGVELCESDAPPESFVAIEADLPVESVFCKDERVGFDEAVGREAGVLLPNHAHLNFQFNTAHDAWVALVDHFEAKGWERVDQNTDEGMLSVVFAHPDKGYVLDFSVINENQADNPLKKHRVHAYVVLSQVPCLEKFADDAGVCVDNTLVRCSNGMPRERVDCGAEQQTCAAERYGSAACVSDLCLANKAGSGKWDPESCPPELAKPASD